MPGRGPWAAAAKDAAQLREVFALVPWRMRWQVIGLLLAAAASSLLDLLAVASMVPLTQLLARADADGGWINDALVPLLGTDDRGPMILAVALFVAVAFMVKNLSVVAIRWWSLGITNRASSAVQAEVLRRYMAAPYVSHRRRSRGRIMQVLAGAVPATFNGVLLGYITVTVHGLTVMLLAATLLVAAPLASLAAIVVFGGAALLISGALRPRAFRNGQQMLDLETESWRILGPAIDGFRDARIFRREQYFTDGYDRNRVEAARIGRLRGILAELPKYVLEIVMVLGIFLVALILFATNDDATAIGLLAMFAAASLRIVPSLNTVVANYNAIVSARPSLAMIREELEDLASDAAVDAGAPRAVVASPSADVVIPPADIEVSGLGFRYPDGTEDVLHDVTVTIPKGRTIALVGGSGAGKTTFADILAGLLPATSGSVTVGDIDIADHPRAWLSQIAMVSQKVHLWDETLQNLITFGRDEDEVDEEHLAAVVRQARLEDFVSRLPEGLTTRAGENGARLSGGQAQRIGIARALYTRPQVLILDEATSALDNETEHHITETIEELHGQITVVVVAHRLSTVKHADEILYFVDGHLRSRGTMAQLQATDSGFARLVELGSLT